MDDLQVNDGSRAVSDYAGALRRRWPIIAACVVLGVVAGFVLSAVMPKVYDSTTSVLVQPTGAPDTAQTGGRSVSGINLDTEATLVTSQVVANSAKALLKTPTSADDLVQRVSVTVPPNTQVLAIKYEGSSPKEAQAGSHAFAQAYLDQRAATAKKALDTQVAALQEQKASLQQQLAAVAGQIASLPSNSVDRQKAQANQGILSNQLSSIGTKLSPLLATHITPGTIISEAQLPTSPSAPNRLLLIASALFAGLVIGVALALLVDRFSGRVQSVAEVEALTQLPVLVAVPKEDFRAEVAKRASPNARHFGRLRNAVLSRLSTRAQVPASPDSPAKGKVVHLLGASPGAGTGVVAANLCSVLARPGHPVTLLCADPQSSSPALLGVTGTRGLSDLLRSDADIGEVQQPSRVSPGVYVVVPGSYADTDDELVPDRLLEIVDSLLAYSEFLVIETRPARTSAEGQALAAVAELSVVVVELQRSRREDVVEAARQFTQVDAAVGGVVVVPEVKAIRQPTVQPELLRNATRPGPATSLGIPSGQPVSDRPALGRLDFGPERVGQNPRA